MFSAAQILLLSLNLAFGAKDLARLVVRTARSGKVVSCARAMSASGSWLTVQRSATVVTNEWECERHARLHLRLKSWLDYRNTNTDKYTPKRVGTVHNRAFAVVLAEDGWKSHCHLPSCWQHPLLSRYKPFKLPINNQNAFRSNS